MKKLYCFDFDGTLTKEDTMFLFLKFYNSNKYFIEFAKHIPLFLFLKLGLLDAEKVKKSFISGILKGEKKQKIEELAQKFFKENFLYFLGMFEDTLSKKFIQIADFFHKII